LKAFGIRAWYNSMRCRACSHLSSRASSSWRRRPVIVFLSHLGC